MNRRESQAGSQQNDPSGCHADAAQIRPTQRLGSRIVAILILGALVAGAVAWGTPESKTQQGKPSIPGQISRQSDSVRAVAFSPVDRTLAIGRRDGMIAVTEADGTSRWLDAETRSHGESEVLCLAFSPNGRVLAAGDARDTVTLWDVAGEGLHQPRLIHPGAVNALCFTPDGQTLVTGCDDGKARLWDLRTGRVVASFGDTSTEIQSIACSLDGGTVAAGSENGTIRLWDVAARRETAQLHMPHGRATSLAFAPDGRTLAAGGSFEPPAGGNELILWDLGTGQKRFRFRGHEGFVLSVAFSPDGRSLASASADHTVKLWDTTTGAVRATLTGHQGFVSAVAFSPDGRWVASGGRDALAGLWNLASVGLAGSARIAANPPVTPVPAQRVALDQTDPSLILSEENLPPQWSLKLPGNRPDGDRPPDDGA